MGSDIARENSAPPAFQFYPADFLADENVVLMTNREIGCYIKLMCYCWREGSIPADAQKIARMCGEDGSAMADLWLAIEPCFIEAIAEPGRLVHPRLEQERVKQKDFRKERSESGKKGAKARWGKGKTKNSSAKGTAMAKPKAEPMAKDGSSSSSLSSNNNSGGVSRDEYSPAFEAAWLRYPKRAGGNSKADAWKAWKARLKAGEDEQSLLGGVERYRLFCEATEKVGTEYVKQAATFFGPAEHFKESWDVPPGRGAGATPEWAKLPMLDEQLAAHAAKHNLPAPSPGETYQAYRSRLRSEIERRLGSD